MKHILTSIVLMVLLFPALALGETMDDLVEQDGLFYKKFNPVKRSILLLIRQPGHNVVPFTGTVTGKSQGKIRNGKKDGPWVYYHDNGRLSYKGNYKDGNQDGPWVYYHSNGQLSYKGTYKDNKKDGPYVNYYDNGQLGSKGTYRNGKEDGRWVRYWSNGQLWHKGTYKDGKRDGPRVSYSSDGSEMVVED